jgi:hypothetical protein
MYPLSFNPNFENNSNSKNDVLSVFKEKPEKNMTIRQGMSVEEISEIFSENIMKIILEQFEATKIKFEAKKTNFA